MNHADPQTIKNINAASLKEFIAKGYKNASLRSIAKEAGVTTGAFYGYYKSKEVLFSSIVGEHAEYIRNLFSSDSKTGTCDSYEDFGKSRFTRLIVYTFDNIDGVRLLVAGSEGTSYGEFFHELTSLMADGLKPYMSGLNDEFIHSLISGLFASYCELVIHDAGRCQAGNAMNTLWEFYEAGWRTVLKR
ncbi:MAG: TetR/AcrR family transcriptional regulator [Clostridiales bacterium]|nr:TetR/AcrR family transcriptional regulator [Clostridiales bacterium]